MSDIENIPETYLWCRDVRHSWDHYDVKDHRNKITRRNEMHQVLRCDRCSTLRIRVLTPSGDFIRSGGYVYPDGYLLKDHGSMTPADRAMIRKINIKRNRKTKAGEDE